MSGDWGTGLFRSVEIALTALYMATVGLLVGGIYFIHQELGFDQWGVIALGSLGAAFGIGKMLAKIAIDPLKEHFDQLESFSKETLHELNLPINTITTNTAMLRKTHADEKSLKRLERIELAVMMLKERYNELDYLIKKQMEKETIETFDVSSLVEERVSFLRGLYPGVEWSVDTVSTPVRLDRIGLAKVIDNLIDNGVKYSPLNPKIHVSLAEGVLSIRDEGKGMDEITLMRIYERYYQSDTTMAGYGIGLGLVKRYCDRHGIHLQVQSAPGAGTCVKLDLKQERKENGK